MYGYIDGERVSNSRFIRHEYDPPPPMRPPPPAGQPQPKRDTRYSTKYKYQYAGGKLSEVQRYTNDGNLSTRNVFDFNDNHKEERWYLSDGMMYHRQVSLLDEKGNEIEVSEFNVRDGSVERRYTYKYEFDSKGNWTKRTTYNGTTTGGKSASQPTWVTYRTIEYY